MGKDVADPSALTIALALRLVAPAAHGHDLEAREVIPLAGGDTIVRFRERHDGLRVLGRGAGVRVSKGGARVLDDLRLAPDLASVPTAPLVDRTAAARAVQRFTPFPVAGDDAELVIAPLATGAHLAWLLGARVPPGIPTAPRFLVDARSGRVLSARDAVVFASRASVYVENPVKTPLRLLQNFGLEPTAPGLDAALVRAANCVDTDHVTAVAPPGGGSDLSVHVCDLDATAQLGGDGTYTYDPIDDPTDARRDEDAYSEVSLYWHATRAYRFFQGLRGGDDTVPVVRAQPLVAVSNLRVAKGLFDGDFAVASNPKLPLEPFANAFFTPSGDDFGFLYGVPGGSLWFGQGPRRDYAYDGDVVYHEFTHAVVDATIELGTFHLDDQGLSAEPGAANEAVADYFSSAIAGNPDVGEYAVLDIDPKASEIRSLTNDHTCPAHVIGEVHFDSTPFSGALWQARSALPESDRPRFDAALYEAMLAHPGDGDLSFADLAKLFETTLATTFPAGKDALDAAMAWRGIFPRCTRVVDAIEGVARAPIDPGFPRGFVAPGTYIEGDGVARVPGVVQVRFHVPEGKARVAVSFEGDTAPASALSGSGSGSFDPVVLARWDAPVSWEVKGDALVATADVDGLPHAGTSAPFEIDVQVPPVGGPHDLYVQIANKGDADGLYDRLTLADAADPPQPKSPSASSPSSPSPGKGCNCAEAPGSGGAGGGGGIAAALAAAAAALGRRARQRREPRRPEDPAGDV